MVTRASSPMPVPNIAIYSTAHTAMSHRGGNRASAVAALISILRRRKTRGWPDCREAETWSRAQSDAPNPSVPISILRPRWRLPKLRAKRRGGFTVIAKWFAELIISSAGGITPRGADRHPHRVPRVATRCRTLPEAYRRAATKRSRWRRTKQPVLQKHGSCVRGTDSVAATARWRDRAGPRHLASASLRRASRRQMQTGQRGEI